MVVQTLGAVPTCVWVDLQIVPGELYGIGEGFDMVNRHSLGKGGVDSLHCLFSS